jgi:predicted Ser/Thr protein kinase
MTLAQGQILNSRYRIVRLLGRGGMGAVYQAWDINLEAKRAIKENLDTSPEAQRQFKHEAQILDALIYPNLPRVIDHFILPGQGQYLVMDYVEGSDLDEMMKKSAAPLPVDQVLYWAGQVCDALIYLHSHQPPVIHRDIKPANIKITPQGKAVLVDFGLAKLYDSNSNTTKGARAATFGYAPPEQYGRGMTDAQSDIYALGATLYHLLTGIVPPDSMDIVSQNAPPPLLAHQVNPAVPQEVGLALQKAMQMGRANRFASVADFRAAMRLAPGSGPYPPDRTVLAAPGIGMAAAAGGATIQVSPDLLAQASWPAQAGGPAAPPQTPAAGGLGHALKWLALGAGLAALLLLIGFGAATLFLGGLGAPAAATAVGGALPETPTQSTPAAQQTGQPGPETALAPSAAPSLPPSPSATPTPEPTATPEPTSTPTPAPQGGGSGLIAFSSNRDGNYEIYTLALGGLDPSSFAPGQAALTNLTGSEADEFAPAWSPDGGWIAFGSLSQVCVMTAAGGSRQTLTSDTDYKGDPAWSPDGAQLAYIIEHVKTELRQSNITGEYFYRVTEFGDLWTMSRSGTLQELLNQFGKLVHHPSWSSDGSRIAFEQLGVIFAITVDGSQQSRLAEGKEPAYSPDGRWIAYTSKRDGNLEVYIANADGSNPLNLTQSAGDDYQPAWSPDSTLIAFTSTRDGNPEIYVSSLPASLTTQSGATPALLLRLTDHPADENHPTWAP